MKRKRNLKGQSSIELITGIVFLLLIFTLILFLAYQKTRESLMLKSVIDAKRVVKTFAMSINVIAEQGSSYYKYVSIPETLYKNFNYSLTTYGTWVEISWDSKASPLSSSLVTSNVTVYCLDKSMEKKNKILNDNGEIIITCYRPDLKPLPETFKPREVTSGEIVNLSIKVKNSGVVDSGEFTVLFNSQPIVLSSLGVEKTERVKVEYTAPLTPGNYTIPILVDSQDDIYESIEEDNFYNATIEVT
jgi:hypothetical protein